VKQSTALFIVAVLVLIWFAAEAFPGQQLCATSCISLSGMNIAEQAVVVGILPALLAIGGIYLKRSGKDKNLTLGETTEEAKAHSSPQQKGDSNSPQSGSENASGNKKS
jgi:hypothetical protein